MQSDGPEPSREDVCAAVRSSRYPLLMQVPTTGKAVEWALAYLGCMRLLHDRPCVVLDIDGTVLLNSPDGSTKCVRHFKSLCEACASNGIALFCVTARPEEEQNRAYTQRQLEKCGVLPIEKVFMRPPNTDYAEYKFNARRSIEKQGYCILLSVGDQFADVNFKRPSPEIDDSKIYVGQIGDKNTFAIKLSSEFA